MKDNPRMNKQEMAIAGILAALLVGWIIHQNIEAKKRVAAQRDAHPRAVPAAAPATLPADTAISAANENGGWTSSSTEPGAVRGDAHPPAENVSDGVVASGDDLPRPEEIRVTLENESLRLALSSYGGVARSATLLLYPALPRGEERVAFEYGNAEPLLAWENLPGLPRDAAYEVVESTATSAVFAAVNPAGTLRATRRYELRPDHRLAVRDTFQNLSTNALVLPAHNATLGGFARAESKNEMLSADILAVGTNKVWHLEESLAAGFGATKGFMGCGGNRTATRAKTTQTLSGPGAWVAVKSRFFTHFFICDPANVGIAVKGEAKLGGPASPNRLAGNIAFAQTPLAPGAEITRATTVYIGPKRLSTVRTLGSKGDAVMQFGFFAWFCKLLVPLLNLFYRLIPNYGIAIILLTFLVRVVFWPLTHKTAESSRKMAALQPKIKEIQEKFKGNAQKLQQETMALYREHKVNPLAACVPMFIQLPVFIALFTVLRSAVELRYAPFLWVADLSEPENLFPGLLPVPVNILPILMAGTMALQSYLTPAMGDPAQRKMMMVMMPVMMLFICYSFPSALSLYWTVSQVLAIVQLLHQQRAAARENAAKNPPPDGGHDKPSTRQMRRRLGRG